jgi:putative alpha-1,2-mannosidase
MSNGHREAERVSWSGSALAAEIDPFIGTEPVDLPALTGPAAGWFWPKPQIGNTHPGACLPLGMVSVMPYTGGYPTGYGRYGKTLQGRPQPVCEQVRISGFTHFQQSGVGAIRKYYNYCRVTPLLIEKGGLAALGTTWKIAAEQAAAGFYTCQIPGLGVQAELTVTRRGAIHRYTFPNSEQAFLAVDFSHGGIAIEDGRTLPLRAEMCLCEDGTAEACVTMEGLPIRMVVAVRGFAAASTEATLWESGQPLACRERAYEAIRESTFRPFGVVFAGPTSAGQQVELEVSFSLRSRERARRHLHAGPQAFAAARRDAGAAWERLFDRLVIEGGTAAQRRTFATACYHSLLKPAEACDESPFWPWNGPFYFDFATLWDMYKTQIPLLLTLCPEQGGSIVNALLTVFEMEGNFPIGYRLARGYDRFAHQASGLVHVVLADAYHRQVPGIDWERAVALMVKDFARAYGEAFLQDGLVHPITHTLDLAYAAFCTAMIAHGIGDAATAARMNELAACWRNAYAPDGLLRDSTFYEGTAWNYSFRLLHDMAGRIALSGGDAAFVRQLDQFFGIGADPVRQPGSAPTREEMAAGAALGRFEGFNNEPDLESPFAYVYAGRHDRTCEIVRAGLNQCFGDSPGGLVGNDDSGGMSSCFVWNAIGLFPVAGQDVFLVGSPLFAAAGLQLESGNSFTVEAVNNGPDRPYVVAASLNGEAFTQPFVRWADIAAGGILSLEMSDQPARWASTRPPSESVVRIA